MIVKFHIIINKQHLVANKLCNEIVCVWDEFSIQNSPIKHEAIPVGAMSRHFGEKGWSPDFLRMYSTHLDKIEIRYDLPTPPPPRIKRHLIRIIKIVVRENIIETLSVWKF